MQINIENNKKRLEEMQKMNQIELLPRRKSFEDLLNKADLRRDQISWKVSDYQSTFEHRGHYGSINTLKRRNNPINVSSMKVLKGLPPRSQDKKFQIVQSVTNQLTNNKLPTIKSNLQPVRISSNSNIQQSLTKHDKAAMDQRRVLDDSIPAPGDGGSSGGILGRLSESPDTKSLNNSVIESYANQSKFLLNHINSKPLTDTNSLNFNGNKTN